MDNQKTDKVARFILIVNEAINNVEYMYQPTINAMNYKMDTLLGIWESINKPDLTDITCDQNVNFFNITLLICEMLADHNKYECNMNYFLKEEIREISNMCTKFLNIYIFDKNKLKTKFKSDSVTTSLIDKFHENLSIFNADIEMSLKFKNVFTKYLKVDNQEVLFFKITVFSFK